MAFQVHLCPLFAVLSSNFFLFLNLSASTLTSVSRLWLINLSSFGWFVCSISISKTNLKCALPLVQFSCRIKDYLVRNWKPKKQKGLFVGRLHKINRIEWTSSIEKSTAIRQLMDSLNFIKESKYGNLICGLKQCI